ERSGLSMIAPAIRKCEAEVVARFFAPQPTCREAILIAEGQSFQRHHFIKPFREVPFCFYRAESLKVRLFASSEIQSRQNYRTFTIKIDTKNPLRRLSHKGSKRVAF
ncbi:MAG: hypothetical protein IJT84_03175, partial [Clostridia bacterium]|nr:hypothetical protein [Clostridia bacterium]